MAITGVRVPIIVPVGWAGATSVSLGDGAEAVALDTKTKASAATRTNPPIKASACLAAAVDLLMCNPPVGSEDQVYSVLGELPRIILASAGYLRSVELVYEP